MSDEEDRVDGQTPASPSEEEESPVEAMEIGDDFRDYISVLSHPGPTPPTLREPRAPPRASRAAKIAAVPVQRRPPEPFGILDLQFDGLVIPPVFSEPETIQAMRRLGYVPEDLTVATSIGFSSENIEIRNKVLRELDGHRMKMTENVIAERNRIANGEPPPRPRKRLPRKVRLKKPRRLRRRKKGKKGPKLRPEEADQRRLEADLARREREVAERLQKQRQKQEHDLMERKLKSKAKQVGITEKRRQLDRERMAKAQKRLRDLDRIQQRIERAKTEKLAMLRAKRDRERRSEAPGTYPAQKSTEQSHTQTKKKTVK
jgi:hypothetical protein